MEREIRASIGSLGILGLRKIELPVPPTTLYLMIGERCMYNCAYCPQARKSTGSTEQLSRVVWPKVEWDELKGSLLQMPESVKRICFQVVNSPGFLDDLLFYIRDLVEFIEKNRLNLPISVSARLTNPCELQRIFDVGAERVGLPLDAVSKDNFADLRGGNYKNSLDFILNASKRFPGKITTHLIVGLQETDRELYDLMEVFFENGITVGLFSFTPIKGTQLENLKPPSLTRYRKIQFLRYLLFKKVNFQPEFDGSDALIAIAPLKPRVTIRKNQAQNLTQTQNLSQNKDFYNSILEALCNSTIFMTSGCPNCNRPFYNESPAGPIFNYPFKPNREILTCIVETFIEKISENELRFKT
jgi:biotin synthase